MASFYGLQSANDSVLKRTFATVTRAPSERESTSKTGGTEVRKLRRTEGLPVQSIGSKGHSRHYSIKMQSTAGPRMYENHIPSFMSVFDHDPTISENPGLIPSSKSNSSKYDHHQHAQPQSRLGLESPNENLDKLNPTQIHGHQHHESTSTQTSDSTDSSPTTTISTVDSSSLSDPSPSSSPESPITLVPLSSFTGSSFGLDAFQNLKMSETNSMRLPLSDERPMTSPGPRKAKNPKSLALNLNSGVDSAQNSEPSSPSFIKPPPLKPRKKPSLLSLNTGAANTLSLGGDALASPRMPSMLQRRSLKHSVSSPQMLSTPGFGPSGGMTLGERKGFGPSRFKESNLATNTFTISEDADTEEKTGVQMATRIPGVAVGGDSFDRPHSGEDAKSPSYPDGPILMYEPSVHLYLEPKVEEAMQFDVVINVAREVKNPFKVREEQEKAKEMSLPIRPAPDTSDIAPDTAASMMSFKTAFEVQPSGSTESSPTTPRPSTENKVPEYIHVPWDHNTDVKDELWDLCETIDSRVKEGKKVLVHCQQGASRSATLIIAYGMYINQDLGATEAYSLAQSRSKWVNPNMSLLFSLNDFKKVIEKKKAEKLNNARKPVVKHRPTLSADATETPSTPSRARGNSTPSASARDGAMAPEVKEAPNSENAATRFAAFDFGFGDRSFGKEFSHSLEKPREESEWEALMSPRIQEMTSNPIQGFPLRSVSADPEVPPSEALFSPTVFEFPRSSFFPSPVQRMSLAVVEDPRSPPTKGEAPITRSIDDFL
ncbi:dual specificity phosphatase [Halenospora varia]|nr:dual specificity phosphatase [Halenospora varia]